jgi:hypothetical protein
MCTYVSWLNIAISKSYVNLFTERGDIMLCNMGAQFMGLMNHCQSSQESLSQHQAEYILCLTGIGVIVLLVAGLHEKFILRK